MTVNQTPSQKPTPKRKQAVKIGKRLKALRIKNRMTQLEMGQALNITDSSWRLYELGLRIPNDEAKMNIANFFGKSVDELFFK